MNNKISINKGEKINMCKDPEPGETVVSEQTFGQQPSVGIKCNKFSREDHTHGTPPAPIIPVVPSPSNTVVAEQSFGQPSSAGLSTEYSREDHTHGTPQLPLIPSPATTVVTEQLYSQPPSVGNSTNYAREDHTHGTPNITTLFSNILSPLRTFNTVYQNTSGKPIFVSISCLYSLPTGGTARTEILVDSVNPPVMNVSECGPFNNSSTISIAMSTSFMVPNGYYYQVTPDPVAPPISIALTRWTEWS